MKSKTNYLLCLLFIFTFFQKSDAQTNIPVKKWSANAKYYKIKEANYPGEDAVMISREIFLTQDYKENYSMYTGLGTNTIKTKIRIHFLTQNGIDEYAKIRVPKMENKKIDLIGARTIKPDGKTIELRQEEVKELSLNKNDGLFSQDKYYIFAVPGVEINDQVEIIYTLSEDDIIKSYDFYFHTYLPVIYSTINYTFQKGMVQELVSYNNAPEPKKKEDKDYKSYFWELTNLPSLSTQDFSINELTIPYIRFSLKKLQIYGSEKEIETSDWAEYLIKTFDKIDLKISFDDKKLKSFLKKYNSCLDKTIQTPIEKLNSFHRFIRDSVTVVQPYELEEKYTSKKTGKFLMSNDELIVLYEKFLMQEGFKYALGGSKIKYYGEIDQRFTVANSLTHLFYLIEINGIDYCIFPKDEYGFYYINEIPIGLEGTLSLCVSRDKPKIVKDIILPSNFPQDNYCLKISEINMYLEADSAFIKAQYIYSGSMSTEQQWIIDRYFNDKDFVSKFRTNIKNTSKGNELDTIKISKRNTNAPHKFQIKQFSTSKNFIKKLDKDIYSIQLGSMVGHDVLVAHSGLRYLDYYPLYEYKDTIYIQLNFDQDISVINDLSKEKIAYEDSFGKYELTIKTPDKRHIEVYSVYQIKATKLLASEYQKLINLFETVYKANIYNINIKTEK